MLQTDAAPGGWFDTGKPSALRSAAGKTAGLYLCGSECLTGCLEVLHQTPADNGLPQALYAGKAGVSAVNNKKPENGTVEEQPAGKPLDKTRFGLTVEKLGIGLISAHTPGRGPY